MLLQVIALVFAFATRKVKVKGLDDSKYITAAIYVTSIVLAVTIVTTYSLKDFVNTFPALFCTGFLTGTTVILGLVFVPKVGDFKYNCYHKVADIMHSLREGLYTIYSEGCSYFRKSSLLHLEQKCYSCIHSCTFDHRHYQNILPYKILY